MKKPILSISELAKMFNTSEENIKKQYAANAAGLKRMYDKAINTGKKVNGFTAEELKEHFLLYEKLSK